MKRGYLSKEEKDFIYENSLKFTIRELAQKLDRSYDTIRGFIRRRGLVCKRFLNIKSSNNPFGLTDREIEVLELMSQGLSNKEILDKLVIATSTLKTYMVNIYGKMQISGNGDTGSELRVRAVLKWLGVI